MFIDRMIIALCTVLVLILITLIVFEYQRDRMGGGESPNYHWCILIIFNEENVQWLEIHYEYVIVHRAEIIGRLRAYDEECFNHLMTRKFDKVAAREARHNLASGIWTDEYIEAYVEAHKHVRSLNNWLAYCRGKIAAAKPKHRQYYQLIQRFKLMLGIARFNKDKYSVRAREMLEESESMFVAILRTGNLPPLGIPAPLPPAAPQAHQMVPEVDTNHIRAEIGARQPVQPAYDDEMMGTIYTEPETATAPGTTALGTIAPTTAPALGTIAPGTPFMAYLPQEDEPTLDGSVCFSLDRDQGFYQHIDELANPLADLPNL